MPELVIAACIVFSCACAAYEVAGWPAAVLVVAVLCVAGLAVVDRLLPRRPTERPLPEISSTRRIPRSASVNLWSGPARAAKSALAPYQVGPERIRNIAAARLAQKYGVNLYSDPVAARRIVCQGRGGSDLWKWVKPAAELAPSEARPRIAARDLARLVHRLEKL